MFMPFSAAPLVKLIDRARASALDLAFPPRCAFCGADVADAGGPGLVCDDCCGQLLLHKGPVCPRCAARVPAIGSAQLDCNHCRSDKLHFERAIALGEYEGLLREIILRMKSQRNGLVAQTLVELAWRRAGLEMVGWNVDVVTAVPMHPWRRWQRGANAPRSLAEALAQKLSVPAAGGMLRQRRNVPPQIGLSRPARFRNVAYEMTVRPGYHLQAAHVLVVDDVLTTGATLSEAARALRRAGAERVSAFVIARTPAG